MITLRIKSVFLTERSSGYKIYSAMKGITSLAFMRRYLLYKTYEVHIHKPI